MQTAKSKSIWHTRSRQHQINKKKLSKSNVERRVHRMIGLVGLMPGMRYNCTYSVYEVFSQISGWCFTDIISTIKMQLNIYALLLFVVIEESTCRIAITSSVCLLIWTVARVHACDSWRILTIFSSHSRSLPSTFNLSLSLSLSLHLFYLLFIFIFHFRCLFCVWRHRNAAARAINLIQRYKFIIKQ